MKTLPEFIAGKTLPEMPLVKVEKRMQKWYRWKCSWKEGRRKCKTVIQGPNHGPVDRSSDQHWQKHIRSLNDGKA